MKKFETHLSLILLLSGISSAESTTSKKESNALLVEESLSREAAGSDMMTSSVNCVEPDSCSEEEALSSTNDGILHTINYSWRRFQMKFKLWSWHDTVVVMILSCSMDGCTLTLCYVIGFIRKKYEARKQRRSLQMTRLQRKNRAFKTKDESEEEPERKRLLLAEPELKPWLLKLKKKRHEERLEIISSILSKKPPLF
ncbi:uncharacterized protein LOC111342462 [Stylophora pistillata]|uniref:uncharacterized protein LOC111342462 n=1 Tax=Stylophora pistillata TaxID=50429 RepID=UPI000C04BEF6|nr:uncharacterized protein LOC111342462 [Stylophora pistillata]